MNRQERRHSKKPSYRKESRLDIAERICKNGITLNDLKQNYDNGFSEGYRLASEDAVKACYAALILALNELHGFGAKRCTDVLQRVDEIVRVRITGEEVVEEAFNKIGLKIDFESPLERIEQMDI